MARILIIDDEIQVRTMLRQMFEREGHEVIDAPDGKVAISLHREEPTDLIITIKNKNLTIDKPGVKLAHIVLINGPIYRSQIILITRIINNL